jgi:hypothetical protein
MTEQLVTPENDNTSEGVANISIDVNTQPIIESPGEEFDWQVQMERFPIIETNKKHKKKLRKFYEEQNEMVEELKAIKEKIQAQKERARKHKQDMEKATTSEPTDDAATKFIAFEKEERLTPAQVLVKVLILLSF